MPMSPQEREVITGIFERLKAAAHQPREPEAERLIGDLIRQQPYAPYVMAQQVFVLEEAVKSLQARAEALEAENRRLAEAPKESGGFLSSLFGAKPSGGPDYRPDYRQPPAGAQGPQGGVAQGGVAQGGPWGRTQPAGGHGGPGTMQGGGMQAPGMMGQPGAMGGGMMGGMAGGAPAGGGFMRSALTTAAGVAGGMVLANALTGALGGGAGGASALAGLGGAGAAGAGAAGAAPDTASLGDTLGAAAPQPAAADGGYGAADSGFGATNASYDDPLDDGGFDAGGGGDDWV